VPDEVAAGGFVLLLRLGTDICGGAGAFSNTTDSISDAAKVISRLRGPSPTSTVNLPPENFVILPLIMLPFFSRIVSANTPADITRVNNKQSPVLNKPVRETIFPPIAKDERFL
jgi:hypothetical protein